MALELTPSQVTKFVVNALLIRKIPYVAGTSGIGKSDLIDQVASSFRLMLLDVRLSQKLPEDLTGLPRLNETINKAEYTPFDTFPMEGDEIPKGYDGWLVFLDELSSASDEVWAAIYSLLLGHSVGGRKLHPKALICAAGNRASDSAIARELPDTLITRILSCTMKVSSKDWLIWAAIPENKINRAVTDFITKNPDMLLNQIHHSKRAELETYGTPRGWETVSRLTNLHEKNTESVVHVKPILDSSSNLKAKAISEDINHGMQAAVGFMEAMAFTEFYNEQMTIPYPWEVAQSPSSIIIPTSEIGIAELTEDLVVHFMESGAQSREAILLYMNRNSNETRAIFCTLVKAAMGETVSDIALLKDINSRLMTHQSNPNMKVQDDGTSIADVVNNTRGDPLGVSTMIIDPPTVVISNSDTGPLFIMDPPENSSNLL